MSMMSLPQRDWLGGDNLSTDHDHNLRLFLATPQHAGGYNLFPTERDLKTAVVSACKKNPFHPIRKYLNGL